MYREFINNVFVPKHLLQYIDLEEDNLELLIVSSFNKTFCTVFCDVFDTPTVITVDRDGEVIVSAASSVHDTLGVMLDLHGHCWYHGDEYTTVGENFKFPPNTSWYDFVNVIEYPTRILMKGKDREMLISKIKEKLNC